MLVLLGIVVAGATLAFVIAPLVMRLAAPLSDGPDAAAELRELHALKDVAYESLRDLEFDYHSGKVEASDYEEMHERSSREALDLVRRIDALEARLRAAARADSGSRA